MNANRSLSENITGYIIRVVPAKEADLVLHVITTQGNKVVCYAKGTRKQNSRKAHALDLLNLVTLKVSSKTELAFVNEVKLMSSQRSRLSSLHGLMTIQMVCELLEQFSYNEDQPQLFIWLENLIPVINDQDNLLLVSNLAIRLLALQGMLPQLKEDALTGQEILSDSRQITPETIGYINSQVLDQNPVSDRLVKCQLFMLRNPFGEVIKLGLSRTEQLQLLDMHLNWVEQYSERRLKSRQVFLQSLT
jgi:DNA repair protein RecO